MKTSFLLTGLIAPLLFASCSSDDDQTIVPGTKAISFSASAPSASSSKAVTTTSDLRSFRVYGFVDRQIYMNGVHVTRSDNGWAYSPVMYWPVDKTVNFYSYSPDIITTDKPDNNINTDNPDIPGYVNEGTTDLLYGVNLGLSSGQVKINFRHALSQVVFRLKRVPTSPIAITVTSVDMTGTYTSGSFRFPRETTEEGNIDNVKGTWSEWDNVKTVNLYNGTPVTLTDTPVTLNNTERIFTIPQSLSAKSGTDRGACLRLTCRIADKESGVIIWPQPTEEGYDEASKTAYIYFPLASTEQAWEPGKAYRYTISVGVPHSSGAIEFDVTVDKYQSYADMRL